MARALDVRPDLTLLIVVLAALVFGTAVAPLWMVARTGRRRAAQLSRCQEKERRAVRASRAAVARAGPAPRRCLTRSPARWPSPGARALTTERPCAYAEIPGDHQVLGITSLVSFGLLVKVFGYR
jgi:hypothetical protein